MVIGSQLSPVVTGALSLNPIVIGILSPIAIGVVRKFNCHLHIFKRSVVTDILFQNPIVIGTLSQVSMKTV